MSVAIEVRVTALFEIGRVEVRKIPTANAGQRLGKVSLPEQPLIRARRGSIKPVQLPASE